MKEKPLKCDLKVFLCSFNTIYLNMFDFCLYNIRKIIYVVGYIIWYVVGSDDFFILYFFLKTINIINRKLLCVYINYITIYYIDKRNKKCLCTYTA